MADSFLPYRRLNGLSFPKVTILTHEFVGGGPKNTKKASAALNVVLERL
jgi:hypothetical protein